MGSMQVLVAGNSDGGAMVVKNLIVSGYLDGDSGKELCKKDGWKVFTNPVFKNQGNCVSYFESRRP